MLKQGGKPSHSHKAADFIEVRQCQRCSEKGELIPCSYCSREICNSCVMQCERCQETFCTACSTIKYSTHHFNILTLSSYDMRYDRVFCHTCNDEEQVEARGRQNKSMINSNNAPYVMSKV